MRLSDESSQLTNEQRITRLEARLAQVEAAMRELETSRIATRPRGVSNKAFE